VCPWVFSSCAWREQKHATASANTGVLRSAQNDGVKQNTQEQHQQQQQLQLQRQRQQQQQQQLQLQLQL
jgi:hypothetical protein